MSIDSTPAPTPTRVLVAGGAYGGLSAALSLLRLCSGEPLPKNEKEGIEGAASGNPTLPIKITIVDERDGFYHLIGSPLALSSSRYAPKAWLPACDIAALHHPSIIWLRGSVKRVDPVTKTASIMRTDTDQDTLESYDYFIAATGLRRVFPTVPRSLSKARYLQEAGKHIATLQGSKDPVVIVGGGAVGVEMAAELKVAIPELKVVLAHSRGRLMSSEPLPDEVAEKTLAVLVEQGVDVRLNHRLIGKREFAGNDGRQSYELVFSDGSTMRASHVLSAVSQPVPSTDYLPREALDEQDFVRINKRLEFAGPIANASSHFAIGDLIAWSGIKRCGRAMHSGASCAHNIHQQLLHAQTSKEPEWAELPEIPPMIALALGSDAVAWAASHGVQSGQDVMQRFFGDDLGLAHCVEHLGLSEEVRQVDI